MALTFRSGSPWWLLEGVEADHRAGQHRQGIKRSDHDLDTATTELRTLRRQQRRAEHRISDLADDLGDIRSTVDRNAARELVIAKVVAEAKLQLDLPLLSARPGPHSG
jgi:hypothetical protein